MADKQKEKKQNEKTKKAKKPAAVAATAGGCLDVVDAGMIVQKCSGGGHDIDLTLEQIGMITGGQREVFRECVFKAVRAKGCQIDRGDIPNGAKTTLLEVMTTIASVAS